jgi:hypothetical protein
VPSRGSSNLSEEARKGMQHKAEQGIWPAVRRLTRELWKRVKGVLEGRHARRHRRVRQSHGLRSLRLLDRRRDQETALERVNSRKPFESQSTVDELSSHKQDTWSPPLRTSPASPFISKLFRSLRYSWHGFFVLTIGWLTCPVREFKLSIPFYCIVS